MTAHLRLLLLWTALLLGLTASACATAPDFIAADGAGRAAGTARLVGGFGGPALTRISADMDPAMIALAKRHDGLPSKDYWDRTPGWETLSLARLPSLGVGVLSPDEARILNALIPPPPDPPPPAKPFYLKASQDDWAAALKCLTQAIYYEAATEPLEGQQAVAQTVLNRLRHPAYPKSVCGVVYQGSMRVTGCQFSFTCDGSLARVPIAGIWSQAERVANRALTGFVMAGVGTATHYHADYVAPYWAPTLYRITQIGRHIFYRWTGPWGLPPAFTGRYVGGEAQLTQAILQGLDSRTQGEDLTPGDLSMISNPGQLTRSIVLNIDGVERNYTVTVPGEPGSDLVAPPGALTPSRRPPTPEEIKEINAKLKALEDERKAPADDPDAPISTAPPAPPPPRPPTPTDGDLPIGRRDPS